MSPETATPTETFVENIPTELGEEELASILEERTRRRFGLSLDEFVAALDVGQLAGTPGVADIAILIEPAKQSAGAYP